MNSLGVQGERVGQADQNSGNRAGEHRVNGQREIRAQEANREPAEERLEWHGVRAESGPQECAEISAEFLLSLNWMCFLPPRQRMFSKVPHSPFALKSRSFE